MRNRHRLITLTLCSFTAITQPLSAEESPTPDSTWKQAVEAGLNGSNGSSDSLSLHLGYTASRKGEEDGWKFLSAFDKAESGGVESRNQFFADLQREWFWQGNPWFGFVQGRYDKDKFKDWDYRLSATGGAGYEFIKHENWYLNGRLGLGGNRTYGDTDEAFTTEALLALDAVWAISEREAVDFNTTFYPNLEESDEYRNITSLNWKMRMTEAGNLAMKIGLINSYDSLASEVTGKNDFKYNFSLTWGF